MYRVISTGEVKSQAELRQIHKGTSFPRVWNSMVLQSLGVEPVFDTPRPEPTRNYTSFSKDGVVKDAKGNWVWSWKEADMFEERTDDEGNVLTKEMQEQAYQEELDNQVANAVRAQRDELLSKTDWLVTKSLETGEAVPAEVLSYRQALRDITNHANFPYLEESDWPVKPAE